MSGYGSSSGFPSLAKLRYEFRLTVGIFVQHGWIALRLRAIVSNRRSRNHESGLVLGSGNPCNQRKSRVDAALNQFTAARRGPAGTNNAFARQVYNHIEACPRIEFVQAGDAVDAPAEKVGSY